MSEDPDLRAVQYVLGTLGMAERAAYERDRAGDPKLAAAQSFWEERLASLAPATPPIVPGAALWNVFRAASAPSSRRWWIAALGALGLGLVLIAALRGLRPRGAEPRAFAVLDRGGQPPALVVTIDAAAETVRVHVLAAEMPREGSLELWFIAPGAAPRSLGRIAAGPLTRLALPAADRILTEGATLAVSVEGPGGATTGVPAGTFVYRGRLVRE
ncbi:anti-sigma factor [Methylobacterium sp. JK268]